MANYYINPKTGKALTQEEYVNAPYGTTRHHRLVCALNVSGAEHTYKTIKNMRITGGISIMPESNDLHRCHAIINGKPVSVFVAKFYGESADYAGQAQNLLCEKYALRKAGLDKRKR
jgi:hypothetical protein